MEPKTTKQKTENQTLSLAETCLFLGVSEPTLRKLIKADSIQYNRIDNGRYIFSLEYLERWILGK